MTSVSVDRAHPARSVFRLLKPHRRKVALAVFWFAVKDSPVWLLPLLTANIIDVVVQHQPIERLWLNAGFLALVLVQNVPTHVLWVRYSSQVTRKLGVDLRSALSQHLQELSIGFHNRAGVALVQTKVVRDVENLEQMLQQVAQAAISAIFTLIGALTLTAIRVPQFVPLFLLAVPATAALVSVVRARTGRRNEQFRRRVELLNARVGEMAQLIPITRAHGLERVAAQRLRGTAEEVGAAGYRLDMANAGIGAFAWVVFQLFGAASLVGAAWTAYTGALPVSAGDVVLMASYFALLTSATTILFGMAPAITKGLESVRSIGEVLEDPDVERNEGRREVTSVRGEIEMRRVSYAFAPDQPAVSDFNLVVHAGETIAFVGPSGAGKSTTLNLLLGFLRPTSGQIMLDGVDAEELDLRTYRRHLSVVPQESMLFDGTVCENVTYGIDTVDDETVRQALRDANALEFVEALPQGWDTVIGERGARLSGGQRQRLAIARALVRDPRVLLLDEATSALDTQSEALIQAGLARLMQGRTTLVVAHRLSTIRSADRVVVLSDGRMVQIGTHSELMATPGLYARLYSAESVAA